MSESKYKSEALAAIHETMDSWCRLGVIDEEAMEHFDKACLVKPFGEPTNRFWWRENNKHHDVIIKMKLESTQQNMQAFMYSLYIVEIPCEPEEIEEGEGYDSTFECHIKKKST